LIETILDAILFLNSFTLGIGGYYAKASSNRRDACAENEAIRLSE